MRVDGSAREKKLCLASQDMMPVLLVYEELLGQAESVTY
jgi:hypothetical protein